MSRYRATHIAPAKDHTYLIVVVCLVTICLAFFAVGLATGIAAHQ